MPDPAAVRIWRRGRDFADFAVGDAFDHPRSRTLTEADAVLFSTAALAYTPAYLDLPAATRSGQARGVVNPYLVLAVTVGLSVEDLSERSDAFLGLGEVSFERAVAIGETLSARSVVTAVRTSASRPGRGIVTWRTEGIADGRRAVVFDRSNLFTIGAGDGAAV